MNGSDMEDIVNDYCQEDTTGFLCSDCNIPEHYKQFCNYYEQKEKGLLYEPGFTDDVAAMNN